MKDSELNIDLTCHVLYSKPCKAQIQSKIALHYPEGEQEAIWTRVQKQYAAFLSDWRTNLGGAKNFQAAHAPRVPEREKAVRQMGRFQDERRAV